MAKESKYQNYIYFEENSYSGINWYIARRESGRILEVGHSDTYAEAVKESQREFTYKEGK